MVIFEKSHLVTLYKVGANVTFLNSDAEVATVGISESRGRDDPKSKVEEMVERYAFLPDMSTLTFDAIKYVKWYVFPSSNSLF